MAYTTIHAADLDTYLAEHHDAVLLDVREQSEWELGHHPRAALLPYGLVALKIQDVVASKDQPIVVYCRSGARSSLAAQVLDRLGYVRVMSVSGGYDAYVNTEI